MQYQGQTEQNQTMEQPPAYVTTKDLSYLKDAMSWELTAMKKFNHFAQECTDNNMKQILNEVGRMHQTHYEILLSHVDPNSTLSSY
jgi:hypothetical protein